MKRLTRVLLPTTLLLLSLAPAALAGSVAVVTFAELPSDFDAGTPYELDYSILAHGTEPMPFSDTALHFQGPSGQDLTFSATSSGRGRWTAEVILPEAGEWQWEVVSGDQFVQTLGTLPVLPVVQVAKVARSLLQEDPAAGDSDELKVKIVLHSHVPPVFTDGVYTDQEVLTSA